MSRKKLSLLLTLVLLLSGCGVGAAENTPVPASTPKPVPTAVPTPAVPTPTPYDGAYNPLTGLPLLSGSPEDRPIAIMLNNLKGALPQLGVSQADIIYEVLAEGGITRMLGVYQSVEGVGNIGSVRSSRPYYLELALGHDAVYLHAGGSPDAYDKIREWNVTALDCVNGPYEGTLFWRDSWRRKNLGYEHSVITSGERITSLFPSYSFRKQHSKDYHYKMSFTEDGTPVGGQTADTVKVPFSDYKTGVFTYEPEAGTYLVSEYGKPYVDGNSGEQVEVTNLLILKTRCANIAGDTYGRITVELNGGEGWFACTGKYVPIRWEKGYPDGQLYYETEDGRSITLGQGRSYVCIVPTGSAVEFS